LLANISLWQNQYAFIHDAVLEALLCGDTRIPAFDLQRAVERLTQTEEEENGGKTGFEQQFEVNYNSVPITIANRPKDWPYLYLLYYYTLSTIDIGASITQATRDCH
jgi:hypothetical protein